MHPTTPEGFMKTADIQKVLGAVQDTAAEALDHMAKRFTDAAEKFGDDYSHISDFSKSWSKLSKNARKLFVEQLLKSTGLVLASAAATKAGLHFAGKTQRKIRKVVLNVADMVEPAGKKAKKVKSKAKKLKDKAKKKLK